LSETGEDVSQYRGLIVLNPYAVQYRYEVFDGLGVGLDRMDALRMVKDLAAQVEGLLSGGAGTPGTRETPARYHARTERRPAVRGPKGRSNPPRAAGRRAKKVAGRKKR
jgi:hypothetical protein